ncbi:MAG: hypothetical protein JNL39_07500 [Opitutaceae bacterium]|nr:hypothetical protein [Opitutaceae bacterium]
MKDRLFLVAMLLVVGAALYFGLARPNVTRVPKRVRAPVEDLKPVFPPIELPAIALPEIPAIALPPAKDVIPVFNPPPKK